MSTSKAKDGKIVQIDEERIKKHLGEIVRGSVQETLNELLDAEADSLCNAKRYERTDARKDTRAGHCLLRQPSSSGIADGSPLLKRRLWRCIWLACQCAGLRT